jgi:enolase-phosphatase E1
VDRALSILAPAGTRAILLDVEGTTTPVDYVHQTLFPFARERVRAFLEANRDASRPDVGLLRAEHAADLARGAAPPEWTDTAAGVTAYVHWLMDQDRKSTGLKSLQGKIWAEGYRSGALRGEVYPDVPPALERWRQRGLRVAIFSSGSVLAQQLIFGHSTAGDLTPLLDSYFDTTVGAKRDAQSYVKIAAGLELEPAQVLFLSDTEAELDAAHAAGMRTGLCARGGAPPDGASHARVASFDAVLPQ